MPDTLAAGDGNETRKTKLEKRNSKFALRRSSTSFEFRVSNFEFRLPSFLKMTTSHEEGLVTAAGSLKSQGLAEGFLRFVVFVAVAHVELVGAFANHV